MTVPACVDEARGAVDEQTEATERGLALEPGHQVVGQRDALVGGAEHELARVEDERGVVLDLDDLGQVFLGLLRVDVRRGVVAEHPEVAVDVQVHGRRLHIPILDRVDDDPLGREASRMERSDRITGREPTDFRKIGTDPARGPSMPITAVTEIALTRSSAVHGFPAPPRG